MRDDVKAHLKETKQQIIAYYSIELKSVYSDGNNARITLGITAPEGVNLQEYDGYPISLQPSNRWGFFEQTTEGSSNVSGGYGSEDDGDGKANTQNVVLDYSAGTEQMRSGERPFAEGKVEHIRGIQLVHTVLVHIDQHTLLAVVPDQQVVQMLPCPFCQQRRFNKWVALIVKKDEIGMIHLGAVELIVAGTDGGINGGGAVILPFPFFAHQGGVTKHLIDQRRIRTSTEGDHTAQRQICFRMGPVVAVVAMAV